jgi:hypothetical protein
MKGIHFSVCGFMLALAAGSVMSVEVTPYASPGSVTLQFQSIPQVEQIGGLRVAIDTRSRTDISAISIYPAVSGAWSQIRPELVRTGSQIQVYAIAPTILYSSDSSAATIFAVTLAFSDTALFFRVIDSTIATIRVLEAITVGGMPVPSAAITWNASLVSTKPFAKDRSIPAAEYRCIRRLHVLSYRLARIARVQASVINAKGKMVRVLMNGMQPAGIHDIRWNGTNASGEILPSGTYFLQLHIGNFTYNKKVSHLL